MRKQFLHQIPYACTTSRSLHRLFEASGRLSQCPASGTAIVLVKSAAGRHWASQNRRPPAPTSEQTYRWLLQLAASCKGETGKGKAEKREWSGLRHEGQAGEQAVDLAVDSVREVEGIREATIDSVADDQGPKTARRLATGGDWNGSKEGAGHRIERVDLARDEAEIADQQIAAEFAERRRGEGDAPWRREFAAYDQRAHEIAVRVEHRHRPVSLGRGNLGRAPGWRIGDVYLTADGLHVEWDERPDGRRGRERACTEIHGSERPIEDVDTTLGGVGGIEAGPRRAVCDSQPRVHRPRRRRLYLRRRARAVVPRGDGAVQVGKDEAGRSRMHQKGRGVVVHLARWPLGAGGGGRDRDLEGILADTRRIHRIERGEPRPLIRNPERARTAVRNPPRILEVGIVHDGEPRYVGNQVRRNEPCARRQRDGGNSECNRCDDRTTRPQDFNRQQDLCHLESPE